MAIFNGHVIVNTGRELLGRALAGEGKIIITRAAMGDGKPNKDIRLLTGLVNEKITANVADIFNDRGTVNLKVQITNSSLEEAFKTEEFGIFAKIEGDEQEVLYSYCTAVEADTIPSNGLGDIFVEEHTVYIAFSSDAEADIYIKEGVVFLTLETANKNYVPTGLVVEGKLSNGRTSLKENCQYQGDNGKWYHNIGGNRNWKAGNGVADNLLVEISYFELYKITKEKLDKGNVSSEYDTAKKIEDKIKIITNDNWKIFSKAIKNGEDLNNCLVPGFYRNELNTNNILNSPVSGKAFILRVEAINQDDYARYSIQTLTSYDSATVYIRYKIDNSWYDWVRQAKDKDLGWDNINNKPSSFPPSAHKHSKSDISDMPTTLPNPYGLTISLNGASQGAYNGGSAKNINITASAVGALPIGGGTITGALTVNGKTTTADVQINGNLVGTSGKTISGFGKVYNAIWNDYAEFFERGEETETGDIIALNLLSEKEQYIKASNENNCVVGVHSNEFAILIGGEEAPEGIDYYKHNIKKFIPVGLMGRVKCKVIGKIKKGEEIGVSHIAGVGIKGQGVGIALENKDNEEIRLIRILLKGNR